MCGGGFNPFKAILIVAAVVVAFVAPEIIPLIGEALGAAAGTDAVVAGSMALGAGTGAAQSAISGGNILEGALTGAGSALLTSGIGTAVSQSLPTDISRIGGGAISGAATGAGRAAITGQNILTGAAYGSASGAISGAVNEIATAYRNVATQANQQIEASNRAYSEYQSQVSAYNDAKNAYDNYDAVMQQRGFVPTEEGVYYATKQVDYGDGPVTTIDYDNPAPLRDSFIDVANNASARANELAETVKQTQQSAQDLTNEANSLRAQYDQAVSEETAAQQTQQTQQAQTTPTGEVIVMQGQRPTLADLQNEFAAGRLTQEQFNESVARFYPESDRQIRSVLALGTPDPLSRYTTLFGPGATGPKDLFSVIAFDAPTNRYVVNQISLNERISRTPELRQQITDEANQLANDVNQQLQTMAGGDTSDVQTTTSDTQGGTTTLGGDSSLIASTMFGGGGTGGGGPGGPGEGGGPEGPGGPGGDTGVGELPRTEVTDIPITEVTQGDTKTIGVPSIRPAPSTRTVGPYASDTLLGALLGTGLTQAPDKTLEPVIDGGEGRRRNVWNVESLRNALGI